jgi:predicted small metal-binding protein
MQAVECVVPGCLHIHAANQEALVELVLRHSHEAHPAMHLSEQAAEDLVDESAYHDKKHSRKSYAHEAGHVLTGLPDP